MEENRNKLGTAADIADCVLMILCVALFIFTGGEKIYVFDRFFSGHIFIFIGYLVIGAEHLFLYLRGLKAGKKTGKYIAAAILTAAISLFGIAVNIYFAFSGTLYIIAETFSDGTKVLLSERTDYIAGHDKTPENELTYIDVYRLKAFKAVKIGTIDETYFSNKCLAQSKYALDYSADEKKLTVSCEYGVYGNSFVHLKEEYDTGILVYEFETG